MAICFGNDRSASAVDRANRFFAEDVAEFCRKLTLLERDLGPEAVPEPGNWVDDRVQEALWESYAACRRVECDLQDDPEFVRELQQAFRQETAHWFERSWIAHRSRTKPSGFPGDYEMLLGLYKYQTPARGIGGYLDLCILDLPLARAVRARLQAARRFLLDQRSERDGTMRVLDIASGPCNEYRDWPASDRGSTEIVAMDTDPLAIDYVNREVVPELPAGVTLNPVRYNAIRTRNAQVNVEKFGRFDLIYSVGLCDYLTDDCLIDMLSAWRQTLSADGVLYVAFKDAERYGKEPYQWHLDWYFYQRTPRDCERLYQQAGSDLSQLEMNRDATGIIMNFISRQRGPVPEPHFGRTPARQHARRERSSE